MTNKQILKRVLAYVGRYKAMLVASMLLALVSVAGSLYIPVRIGNVIDFIIDKGLVRFDKIIPVLIEICVVIGVVALSHLGFCRIVRSDRGALRLDLGSGQYNDLKRKLRNIQ